MTDQVLGRVALVTGGSRGIGRAIAVALAKQGVKVAINWVTNEFAAQQTLEEVRAGGGDGATYQAAVASEGEVGKMVTAVESDLGPIDMLVTSAGIMEAGGYQQLDLETFQQVMRVNVEGTFLPVMAVKDGMIARGRGSIVCISSIAGLRSRPRVIAYSSSKAAVIGFVRSCAGAFGPNVRVNGIAPGLIRTDMTESMDPDVLAGMEQEAFVKRLGVPSDISAAVLFLLSDGAGFISGQTFVVDGGRVTLP